ncbi:MAG: glycoside hydrolase family 3 N-terminal domain-containing protein [Glaciecola sp.]
MNKPLLFVLASTLLASACQHTKSPVEENTDTQGNLDIWPRLNITVPRDNAVESKVDAILGNLTVEQKVAQMIQPEIRDITIDDMRKYGFGSYLNGGGSFPNGNKQASIQDWIDLAESFYQASVDDSIDGTSIPTMWGTDAVHGHNNVIGATLFPHNIGLGAANNPKLIEEIAKVTATEVMVTGIDWIFAPTVATVRDDRWGRTYEGYSESPDIVHDYSVAIVHGLQGAYGDGFLGPDKVLSTVKHFIGDGGTIGGDDQGNTVVSEQTLFDIHAQGYVGGLSAGAQSVMASFNSWNGTKLHGHRYLLTDVLKDKMGFDGFVVGDWSGHGQIEGCTNENCPQSINAGLDMFMSPTLAWKPLFENTVAQVKDGTIPMTRVDDAVRRILRVKVRAGLFDKASPAKRALSGKTELIGAQAHRAVARQAVRESVVLLKNDNQILPLSPKQHFLITGDGAHNIGKQTGGWSVTWQGTGNSNSDFPGATSIYDGLREQIVAAGGTVELSASGEFQKQPDVAIVVYGENPYAEGHGDRQNLEYQRGAKTDLVLLKSIQSQGIPVVSLFISGRPMWVNAEINASNAFAAVWLPGTEGSGIADVMLRDKNLDVQFPITGKLSFSWPKDPYQTNVNYGDTQYEPLFPYGYGLSIDDAVANMPKLNETFTQPSTEVYKSRPMFAAKMHQPWLMWLFSGQQQQAVTSNTIALPGLAFRTTDKNVQEDAIQLVSDGSADVGVRIASKSSFREDLRKDLESGAQVRFEYLLNKPLNGTVLVSMECNSGSECGAVYEITNDLSYSKEGQWQQLSVPLSVFEEAGMHFADTVVPIQITLQGEVNMSIANIGYGIKGADL